MSEKGIPYLLINGHLRYLNINLHAQNYQFCSLNLVGVKGSMSAGKIIGLLEQKLAVYGYNLRKDVVGACV